MHCLYWFQIKGSAWESQVDLLLEYGATLDESCLEAARLSGDKAMIEKVERLMKSTTFNESCEIKTVSLSAPNS